jgi:hypothetical protein
MAAVQSWRVTSVDCEKQVNQSLNEQNGLTSPAGGAGLGEQSRLPAACLKDRPVKIQCVSSRDNVGVADGNVLHHNHCIQLCGAIAD